MGSPFHVHGCLPPTRCRPISAPKAMMPSLVPAVSKVTVSSSEKTAPSCRIERPASWLTAACGMQRAGRGMVSSRATRRAQAQAQASAGRSIAQTRPGTEVSRGHQVW